MQLWNAENGKKVTEYEPSQVNAAVQEVDVSPDSTQIASGSGGGRVFVISRLTRKHMSWESGWDVLAVKFSPDGRLIATAAQGPGDKFGCAGLYVTVNDSQDGHSLFKVTVRNISTISEQPLAWSSNSKQLFALSHDCKIYCLDATTGKTLSQWPVRGNGSIARCITLANNGAFIAVSIGSSVSFWDTTTRKQIGSVIEHGTPVHNVKCMAISENYDIAMGGLSKITFRTIRDILPSTYVSTFASTLNQAIVLTVAVSTGKPRNKGWCQVNK